MYVYVSFFFIGPCVFLSFFCVVLCRFLRSYVIVLAYSVDCFLSLPLPLLLFSPRPRQLTHSSTCIINPCVLLFLFSYGFSVLLGSRFRCFFLSFSFDVWLLLVSLSFPFTCKSALFFIFPQNVSLSVFSLRLPSFLSSSSLPPT